MAAVEQVQSRVVGTARSAEPGRRTGAAATVALVAAALVLLDTAVQVLPDDALVGKWTAARVVILAGLIALVVAGRAGAISGRRWICPWRC